MNTPNDSVGDAVAVAPAHPLRAALLYALSVLGAGIGGFTASDQDAPAWI
jgi:hypothetical protein